MTSFWRLRGNKDYQGLPRFITVRSKSVGYHSMAASLSMTVPVTEDNNETFGKGKEWDRQCFTGMMSSNGGQAMMMSSEGGKAMSSEGGTAMMMIMSNGEARP
jgi:hypothetical protein